MSLTSRHALATVVTPPPAVASKTIQCSVPHGAEGGVSLPFQATNISCATGRPIVFKARLVPCNPTSAGGCRVAGYVCRDAHPASPGHVSAGDVIRCTKGRKAVQFGQPG
jgi:hypothetical protein